MSTKNTARHLPVQAAVYAVGDAMKHLQTVISRHMDMAQGTDLHTALDLLRRELDAVTRGSPSERMMRDLWSDENRTRTPEPSA